MEWNKVWAIGRDTYIRFWPNPGFGICLFGWRRLAISLRGGIEWFKPNPVFVWRRTWSKFSKVKRPGATG